MEKTDMETVDLTGKYVLIAEREVQPQYKDPSRRVLYCESGFGCKPGMSSTHGGKVFGLEVDTGDTAVWYRDQLERLATDDEVAAAQAVAAEASGLLAAQEMPGPNGGGPHTTSQNDCSA